jgi:RNA polymerase sigma factor (sigma-70 family)
MNSLIEHIRRSVFVGEDGMRTDAQLLGAFLERREEAALAALVRRHGPMVWNVCRRLLGSHHDAEDAFQATFLVLVRKANVITPREMLANWLYGVAYQTARKARAVTRKRHGRERQMKEMPEVETAERNTWHDLRGVLDEELSGLPAKYRAAIVLCDVQGKTRKEAGCELGWPEGSVSSRLARARTMLAKRLTSRGFAVGSAALTTVLAPNVCAARVPAVVLSNTTRAAALLASGQVVLSRISPTVLALADSVVKGMLVTRIGLSVALMVMATVGIGIALSARLAQAQRPAAAPAEERAQKNPNARPAQPRVQPEEWKARATFADAGAILPFAFHPNGKTLASVKMDDTTAKLWDLASGKEQAILKANPGHNHVKQVLFSPDGKTLAYVSARLDIKPDVSKVELWDVSSRKKRVTVEADRVAFSPDSSILASKTANVVKLWNVADGKERAALQGLYGDNDRLMDLAFSPDGKTLALAGYRYEGLNGRAWDEVKIWDLASGRQRPSLNGSNGGVLHVAFSSDGRTLAAAGNRWQPPLHLPLAVTLWETATGKQRASFQEPIEPYLYALAFSPDCRMLAWSAGTDWAVRLWNLANGDIGTIKGHTGHVQIMAFSFDGRTLASGSQDKTIKLWDIASRKQPGRDVLSPRDLDSLWATLAEDDAKKAYQAINKLAASPKQAVDLLTERLRPIAAPNSEQINRWIADLDSDQFTVRDSANKELEKVRSQVEPILRQQLKKTQPLEVRRRLERLLTDPPAGELLRHLRALEILEQIGSKEASRVLETIARGAPGARLTEDAKTSLARLQKRVGVER